MAKCKDQMRNEEYYQFKQFKQNLLLNTKKRTLKLAYNQLGVISAEVIAQQIMKGNENFAHYKLASNIFGDEGVSKFCEALEDTCHIVSLDLSMNKITVRGAERIG